MAADKTLISVSIPVYNELDNLDRLYARLCEVAASLDAEYEFEFLFTDNHSTDGTWPRLQELARSDSRVRGLRFSSNVGFQRSILANYLSARGEAVVQLDADLQDPPEMISEFLAKWREGNMVVYGVRRKRVENAAVRGLRRLGYWIVDHLSEHEIPHGAGDFRLIDRRVVAALGEFDNQFPYLRGDIAALGFRQIGIPYDRAARLAGSSKFTIARLVMLGLDGIFNHSTVPLRLATLIGAVALVLSLVGALYYVVMRLVSPGLPTGFASLHVLLLFGIGLNSFFLGIIGEYIARIFTNTKSGPIAVVEQLLNVEPDSNGNTLTNSRVIF